MEVRARSVLRRSRSQYHTTAPLGATIHVVVLLQTLDLVHVFHRLTHLFVAKDDDVLLGDTYVERV